MKGVERYPSRHQARAVYRRLIDVLVETGLRRREELRGHACRVEDAWEWHVECLEPRVAGGGGQPISQSS